MAAQTDYRRSYPTADDLDMTELLPALNRLGNKVAQLEALTGRYGPADGEIADALPKLEALEKRIVQLSESCNKLARFLRRQADNERLPPHLKRRIPLVTKALDAPGDGLDLVRRASALLRVCGGADTPAWRRFCERERRRQAAEAA